MTIMAGWRTAVAIARAALENATVDHSSDAKVPYPHPHLCYRMSWLPLCHLTVSRSELLGCFSSLATSHTLFPIPMGHCWYHWHALFRRLRRT
jgi:hypothetical protein